MEFAGKLLKIDAIRLDPDNPFTWASGWKSPVYCDNRLTLSYPDIRTWIKNTLADAIVDAWPTVEIIAGVATAGIPHGALIADKLNKPFIYVRSEAKKHGLTNQIEGKLNKGQQVVVVEDLISTGGSSLQAVHAIRAAGGEVSGLAALFTYGFDIADQAFADHTCQFITLSDYPSLIRFATEQHMIDAQSIAKLNEWRRDPAHWMQA
jgi:orotate phosphoribosyltransferase